jgi:hypothetical protein
MKDKIIVIAGVIATVVAVLKLFVIEIHDLWKLIERLLEA